MLRILWLEIRRSRMWIWAAAAAIVWFVILIPQAPRWLLDWREAGLWVGVPVMYAGPLLAGGAADVARLRATSGFWQQTVLGGRRRTTGISLHLIAALCVGLVPFIASALIVWIWGASQLSAGIPLTHHTAAASLFATALILLGYVVGTVVRSSLIAPLAAVLLALVLTLNSNPLPASEQPWRTTNPVVYMLFGCAFVALAIAGVLLQGVQVNARRRVLRRELVPIGVAAVTVVLLLVVGAKAKAPIAVSPPTEAACTSLPSGTSICVWPVEKDRYLDKLAIQADRFDTLRSELGIHGAVYVGQPGLVDYRDSDSVVIETVGDGEGLWLTAQSMAYWTYNAIAMPVLSECQKTFTDEETALSWATVDVMTGVIYGAAQPGSVQEASPSDLTNFAQEKSEEVLALPWEEKARWIEGSIATVLEGCGSAK